MRTKEKGESVCGREAFSSDSRPSASESFSFTELKLEAAATGVRNKYEDFNN